MNDALNIGTALKMGWEGFARSAVALIVGTLLVGMVSAVTLGICAGPMLVGYCEMCLRASRGEQVEIADVFTGFSRFGSAFILMLLYGLMVVIGCFLFVLPGLFAAIVFAWSPFVMADGENDPIACLRRSYEFSMQNLGAVVVFLLVAWIVSASGSLVAFGSLITSPLSQMMMAVGFLRGFSRSGMPVEQALPPSL